MKVCRLWTISFNNKFLMNQNIDWKVLFISWDTKNVFSIFILTNISKELISYEKYNVCQLIDYLSESQLKWKSTKIKIDLNLLIKWSRQWPEGHSLESQLEELLFYDNSYFCWQSLNKYRGESKLCNHNI